MSEYIPIEIQAEILKKLPIKPLIQFRSVSKSFKRLIDSPDFIVSYSVGRRQPPDDDRFILRYALPYNYPTEERYISLVDNDDHGFVRQELIPTVPDLINKFYLPFLVGSSHGLLCLREYCKPSLGHPVRIKTLLLWNPSIGKSIGIRVPYMCGFPNFGDVRVVAEVFGFGVCPVTFDPIILRIEFLVRKMKSAPWNILSTNQPRESIRLRQDQVVIDGFIYWVAYDNLDDEDSPSSSNYLIMSFGLTTKEFKEINLPDNLTNPACCIILSISKLRESLVLLAQEFEEEATSLDVSDCCLWMMMEQGVSRSFTKLYTINLPDARINRILGFRINRILGIRKTGELIIEVRQKFNCNAELLIYNPDSEAIDNLGIDGAEHRFFMFSYIESLLLLDQEPVTNR